jgi:radical SAM superfamily enzyme YgiQ (UPF0313 family)
VVGKGIDVERVLEMAQTLNEKGVKMHASLIAGLPNDTEEEIYRWNDYLIENRDRGFRSWSFNALGLMRTGRGDVPYSLFEKNPGAYGYITKELSNNVQSLSWVHTSGMTSDKAQEIALNCTAKSAKYIKIAAWDLAGAWFHDMPEDVVENLPTVQTNFNQRMRENSMQRANYNYNLITGDSLT